MKRYMMVLFAIVFSLSMVTILFAQPTHTIGFESSEDGAGWDWTVAENDDNPPLEFVDNPDATDPNTSETVAKFTARQTGNNWALCFTNDDGEFTFDETNSTVKIMVHKPVISNVGFKVEGATGTPTELTVSNTVTDAWEELTFDFSAVEGQTFGRIVIIPDFVDPHVTGQDRTSENIIYFDNIQVPDGVVPGPLPEPADAAPVPTPAAEEVVSIFSDAYTDLEDTNFNPNWGQSTVVSEVEVEGDSTLLYEGLNFQGIELASAQDLSDMVYLHLDFWSANSTALEVFLISQSAGEKNFVCTMVNESWVSLDIPLSHYTDQGLAITDIFQLKFVGNGTVYLDNLFFSKVPSVTVAEPTEVAPAPAAAASDVISLFSNVYTDVVVDTWSAAWDVADVGDIQVAGDDVKLYTNLTYAGIEFTSQTIDASAMTHFHMDIWTPDPTEDPAAFKVKLVDFGADGAYAGGDDSEHQLTFTAPTLVSESWVSIDVPLSNFTGLAAKSHLAQMVIEGDPNTVYVDNVYFYNMTTAVQERPGSVPSVYALEQNYPNPFNPATRIGFSLPGADHVSLTVYNMLGQTVATLVDGAMNAGTFEVTFDATEYPSGVYYYSLSAGEFRSLKKMLLVK